MKQPGKIIKYIALSLAALIIFTLVSGMIITIKKINIFFNNNEIIENLKSTELNDNIKNISINLLTTKLIIKNGEKISIETNNEHINYDIGTDKIYIKEEKYNVLFENNNYELILYIPEKMIFDDIYIETKVGKINVNKLKSKTLELDLGAGNVEIKNIQISEQAKINGGAGEITIEQGIIKNLDLDMGVGNLNLNASLIGNNEIDAGVGEININLSSNDYQISIDKGLGTTIVNSTKIKEDITLGNGINKLIIDGGIGNININTQEQLQEKNDKYNFEMSIDKYLKNSENEIIILGTILNGTANYGNEIELLDEKDKLLLKTKISNKNPNIYQNTIETSSKNEKVAIIIDEKNAETLKNAKKIIIR